MKKMALHWKIMFAMLVGIAWAMLSVTYGLNGFTKDWISPFGTMFIHSLKFIAVPLVLFSIITGIAGMGSPEGLGRMGGKTLGLYLITTVFSVSVGLLAVNLFQPGAQTNESTRLNHRLQYELWAKEAKVPIKDGRNELKDATNAQISEAKGDLEKAKDSKEYKKALEKQASIQEDQGPLQPLIDLVPENLIQSLGDGRLMLQVIFFAIFFGIALVLIPEEKTTVVRGFFEGMNEIFVKMVNLIMEAAPFFVFCLMAGVLVESANTYEQLISIFIDLFMYTLVVLAGLLVMLFLFYPALLRLFNVKIRYVDFFKAMSPAQFLAFSTSSSAATLPVTIECVNEGLGVPEKSTDFVLPIGATVNMDGTSLYQAVAVIFLAQYYDVDLSLMQQLGIVATATLASIGAAAVPSAGLIMLMIVLESVGLNPLWIAFVLPVDRILDMCRTVINVTSDATVSAIVAKTENMEFSEPKQGAS